MKRQDLDRNTPVEDIPVVLECAINGEGSKKNSLSLETAQEHITELLDARSGTKVSWTRR